MRAKLQTYYTAFGLTMQGISSRALNNAPVNKYKYNGKEEQRQEFSDGSGLETYDFGARMQDPQIGRWWQIDPAIENEHFNYTPYAFVYNDPIRYNDPDGRDTLPSGRRIWDAGAVEEMEAMVAENPNATMHMSFAEKLYVLGENLGLFSMPTAVVSSSTKAVTTTEQAAKTASTVQKNAANGAAFEKQVVADLASEGHTGIVQQVTIKADNGVKARVDIVSTNPSGQLTLTEAKSSATAPLTTNQKAAYPSIAQSGGVVVGAGKPGVLGGTVIAPTQVNIVRPVVQPAVKDATYLYIRVPPPSVVAPPQRQN